jgi:hypothetical protein
VTLGLAVAGWVAVLAATSDTGLGPYAQFANYGILGLIALGFFQGRLVSAKHYAEMRADRDQARGELISLRTKMDDQMIPLLTRVVDVMGRVSAARKIG